MPRNSIEGPLKLTIKEYRPLKMLPLQQNANGVNVWMVSEHYHHKRFEICEKCTHLKLTDLKGYM